MKILKKWKIIFLIFLSSQVELKEMSFQLLYIFIYKIYII